MTNNTLFWFSIVFLSLGVFFGCSPGGNNMTAQTSRSNEEMTPPITSAPDEPPQENGAIDYKNAKPIPMPSLPAPPSLENLPPPPSVGEGKSRPGSAPGSTGTGEENPEVVIPPNPS